VAIAPGGLRLCSCGMDRAAIMWDVASGQQLARLFGHDAKINACDFRKPDGSVVATGSDDGTCRVWDCRTANKTPIQVLPRFKDAVSGLVVTETAILVTSVDGALTSFDVRKAEMCVDRISASPLGSLALSRDGKCVLVTVLGQPGSLELLEVSTGQRLRSFVGHANASYALACTFNHLDSTVLCGSEDGVLRTWDLVSGKVVAQVKFDSPVLGVAHHPATDSYAVATAKGDLVVVIDDG
jgi:mitogen-activated protein kinase organizer 1